jgi:hypothetical protein
MKTFLSKSWYRLLTASALFIFSIGFLIFAAKYNVVIAGGNPEIINTPPTNNNLWIVSLGNNIYEVTYSKLYDKYEAKEIWSKRQ